MKEIVVFHADEIGVELLRRLPGGDWPESPERIDAGEVGFASIGVRLAVAAAYRTTQLAG